MSEIPIVPIRIPRVGCVLLYINKKRRGILYSLIPPSGLRIAFPKDKQRISPRRAVYKRPLPMVLREMLASPSVSDLKVNKALHDKA